MSNRKRLAIGSTIAASLTALILAVTSWAGGFTGGFVERGASGTTLTPGYGVSLDGGVATIAVDPDGGLVVGPSGPAISTAGFATNDRIAYDGTGFAPSTSATIAHHGVEWCEELAGSSANNSIVWNNASCQVANSGSCTIATTSPANHPGVTVQSTAANAAGSARVTSNAAAYTLSSSTTTFEALGVAINTLADGTNDYDVWIGLGDTTSSLQVDGVGFFYHLTAGLGAASGGAANSSKWQIGTSKGSSRLWATLDGSTTDTVSRTVTVGDDSVTPATGEVDNFKITCTLTRCDFYMQRLGTDSDYVRVGSACSSGCSMAETSIPTAQWGTLIQINKTQGGTARILNTDVVCLRNPFSSGR